MRFELAIPALSDLEDGLAEGTIDHEFLAQMLENTHNDIARLTEAISDLESFADGLSDLVAESYDDGESGFPYECIGMEDDADALASCGWGTDEDYGCF